VEGYSYAQQQEEAPSSALPSTASIVFNNDNDKFELVHVSLAIRHGDRSSIHKIPGSETRYVGKPTVLDPHASTYIPRLQSYHITPLDSSRRPITDVKTQLSAEEQKQEMFTALNPSASYPVPGTSQEQVLELFHTPDRSLPPGQLTSVGFMQHVHLGYSLHKAYSSLLEQIVDPNEQLYVRSTNYARTIQSVSALLSSLLPSVGGPAHPLPIHVFVHEEDEIMHGIGMKSSSHKVTAEGEQVSLGTCSKAVIMQQQQKESFEISEVSMSLIESLFGDEAMRRGITDTVDSAMPAYCHGDTLPCTQMVSASATTTATSTGAASVSAPSSLWNIPLTPIHASQCLSHLQLGILMQDADRMYCSRFTGSKGGMNATKLAIYPFVREVVDGLYAAVGLQRSLTLAASATVGSEQPASPTLSTEGNKFGKGGKLLNIYSGHDTVIAPVLAALGVFEQDGYCKWPSYASRIAFELWKSKAQAVTSAKIVESGHSSEGEYFVRVIYNGDDVTHLIPTCQQDVISSHGLCSLSSIERQVESLIFPYSTIKAACK
jgi:hypothetical protein